MSSLFILALASWSSSAKVEKTRVCVRVSGENGGCSEQMAINARDRRVEALRSQGYAVLVRQDSVGVEQHSSLRGSFSARYFKIHVFKDEDMVPLSPSERALLRELIGEDALSQDD